MINDEEDLLKSIHSYVKGNLNTNISAINTEKGDSYRIATIDADDKHYVFSGELQDIPNHAFVAFSIDGEIEVQGRFTDKISLPNIMVEIVIDNEKKEGMFFKSLRYMKALYKTILEYSANEADDIQITKFVPMIASNRGRELIVSGVSLSVAIS